MGDVRVIATDSLSNNQKNSNSGENLMKIRKDKTILEINNNS